MVWVQRHEPERREGGLDVAAAGGCCCCCCCCLHSLGGFIGAVTSTAKPVAAEYRAAPHAGLAPGTLEPRYNVYKEYWVSVLVLSGLVVAVLWPSANFVEGLFVLALTFPGVQLLASFATVILVTLSERPGRSHRYAHSKRLALRGFVGGFIGLAFMVFVGILL